MNIDELIAHQARSYGVNVPLKPRRCSPLPEAVRARLIERERLAAKQCYYNAFLSLGYFASRPVSYVAGFWWQGDFDIAIEHAWVESRGETHDPTAEIVLGRLSGQDVYYPCFTLSRQQAVDMADRFRVAPDLLTIRNALRSGKLHLGEERGCSTGLRAMP